MQRIELAMTKRGIYIAITATLILVIGFAAYPYVRQLLTPQPSNEVLMEAIYEEFPSLQENNVPVFTITSISRYSYEWYLVTIKSIHDTKKDVPVKIILKESDGNLFVALGPDTHFNEQEMLDINLPKPVVLELQKL